MMKKDQNRYVYFLFSEEYQKEKSKILSAVGKVFEPGTVVVNGVRKKYVYMSDTPTIPRMIDTKIVTEGYLNTITYTEPKSEKRRD